MLNERFLLIKAWGYGFWSDVSHVLGQILVAEISGRIPVVHWGGNSLFGDGSRVNAFDWYFDPISDVDISDIQRPDFSYWPPKWNPANLTCGEIDKMAGEFSCIDGRYLINRPERVVVGDFYTGVVDLLPWIPAGHHLHGMSLDDLYFYLVRRYLRPRREIADRVDGFYRERLASSAYIAVHVRGSDKVDEVSELGAVNKQYESIIAQCMDAYRLNKIFLMTDDTRIVDHFTGLYGDRIIVTDCQRTNSSKGVHYQQGADKRKLGIEVMTDAYLAARARCFVGNGSSNPSLIVRYLKDWSRDVYLFGNNMYHATNMFLLGKVLDASARRKSRQRSRQGCPNSRSPDGVPMQGLP